MCRHPGQLPPSLSLRAAWGTGAEAGTAWYAASTGSAGQDGMLAREGAGWRQEGKGGPGIWRGTRAESVLPQGASQDVTQKNS